MEIKAYIEEEFGEKSPPRKAWNEREDMKDHDDSYLWDDDDKEECPSVMNLLSRNLNIKCFSSREEERECFERWLQTHDPDIRQEFLNRNLRLVASEAKKASSKCDFDIPDLMAWGTMGLCRAFDKFDLSKGCKFSTYATLWIRQAIYRGLDNTSHSIKIPCNILQYQRQLKKFLAKYHGIWQEDPTDEELMAAFGWPQEKLDYVRKGLTKVSSLDVAAADGEDSVGDLIADDTAENAADSCIALERAAAIRQVIQDSFDERDADILMNIAELNGKDSLTDAQLAKKYHLTRERIQQIYADCKVKLRHPSKSRKLLIYYDY